MPDLNPIRLSSAAPDLTAPVTRLEWESRAVCAEIDPELFFPEKGRVDLTRKAKAICRQCPVRRECLEQALATDERYGIFGGFTEWERRIIKRRRAGA